MRTRVQFNAWEPTFDIPTWNEIHDRPVASCVITNKCDQIWQNFATLSKSSKSNAIFLGFIYYLAKI